MHAARRMHARLRGAPTRPSSAWQRAHTAVCSHGGVHACRYASSRTKRTFPAAPQPLQTVAAPRRRINTYEVPTSKRRDELVWSVRQAMRNSDADAGGLAARTPSKRIVPNTFVPATEKRRDDLRWAVRTEMAWVR